MRHPHSKSKAKIIVIDDHQLFREGIKRILELEDQFEVLAEGKDGAEALSLVKQYKPDIVLMDVNMPIVNGMEATRKVTEKFPETKVIILSVDDNEDCVTQAIQSGAVGYLLKDLDADKLIETVKVVASGGAYLHPRIARNLIAEYRRLSEDDGNENRFQQFTAIRPLHLLTRRECEILQILADGKSNRGIGEALFISDKTVKNHVSKILQKLDVTDRTQAVVTAIREGWVELR